MLIAVLCACQGFTEQLFDVWLEAIYDPKYIIFMIPKSFCLYYICKIGLNRVLSCDRGMDL